MTFTCKTALHLASLSGYYADKATREAKEAMRWRFFGWCAPHMLVTHHADLAAIYAEKARFYRDRLTEWVDGEGDRAARWEMKVAA
jgi:hypothetical protein